jgi:hypothetical protein
LIEEVLAGGVVEFIDENGGGSGERLRKPSVIHTASPAGIPNRIQMSDLIH